MAVLARALAVGALALLLPAPSRGDTYGDLKKAFDKKVASGARPEGSTREIEVGTAKTKVQVLSGRVECVPIPAVPNINNNQPINTCLRVWAELSDPTGQHSGKYVHLERYRWHPNQRFYLHVASATPVHLAMWQYYDVGPAEAKRPKRVFPKEQFPLSYATVEPGADFCFPQLLKMDDTLADEFVTLTVLQAGQPLPLPIPQPANPPAVDPPLVLLPLNDPMVPAPQAVPSTNNLLDGCPPGSVVRSERGEIASFKDKFAMQKVEPTLPQGVDPLTQQSADANTVSMFCVGSQLIGNVPLRLRK